MQNKKVLTLIILSVFAVISLIYGIMAKPAKGRAGKVSLSQNKNLTSPTACVIENRRAKHSKFKSWKRNPFVPVVSNVPQQSNLVLSGIIWNKEKPKAIIGEAIVTKGDKIGGNTVVDIKPDKVILNDGTKEFELKLEK